MERLAPLAKSDPLLPASRCGIEQEFYVLQDGRQLDFRTIIHGLGIPGARIDPSDVNAYRLADGSVFTADETEAEFATIPVDVVPGFAPGLAGLSSQLSRQLSAHLAGFQLRGAATHVNVSLPPGKVDSVVLNYATTFGPMLQALWDRPSGHGIMIRPRPGRIEFGGEFIAGARLAAVALFCVASVATLAGRGQSIPRFRSAVRPATGRLGIELRRDTYAEGAYTSGRRAVLHSAAGAPVTLASAIESIWRSCRSAAVRAGTAGEVRTIDRVVRGQLPLGIEGLPLPPAGEGGRVMRSWVATPLTGWSAGGRTLRPRYDTWDYTVFECRDREARWFVNVPRHAMGPFVQAAESGRFAWRPPARSRPLLYRSQLRRGGTFTNIPVFSVLVPPERAPGSGWFATAGGAPQGHSASVSRHTGSRTSPAPAPATSPSESRQGKWITHAPPPTTAPAEPGSPIVATGGGFLPPPRLLIVALVLLALALFAGIAVIAFGGGDEENPPPSAPGGSPAAPAPEPDGGAAPVPGLTPTPSQVAIQTPALPSAPPPDDPTATPPGTAPADTATAPPAVAPSATPTATTGLAATPTPQPTSTPPPTATPVPNQPPTVQSISISGAPLTTFVIAASDPEGDPLTYSWTISGENCGTPLSPGSLGSGVSVGWSHASQPPDNCTHAGTDHPATIVLVTVFERGVPRVQCTVESTISRVESPPACIQL